MPERPKRRKNNKNKRKNKNNAWKAQKNNSDGKHSDNNSEQCSETNSVCEQEPSTSETPLNTISNLENTETTNVVVSASSVNEVTAFNNISIATEKNINAMGTALIKPSTDSTNIDQSEIEEKVENIKILPQEQLNYLVESPNSSFRYKPKLENTSKSKSLDDDDSPNIIEITEDQANACSISTKESSNVVVSDIESEVEWETTKDINDNLRDETKDVAKGKLSITATPKNVALCDEKKILTADQELSLRQYLNTLNLTTRPPLSSIEIKTEIEEVINREVKHRLRKKGFADDFTFARSLGPSRFLDVIDEEASGESSLASRRQSQMSEIKSDNEDLEDVFEDCKKTNITPYASKSQGPRNKGANRLLAKQIPQECLLVGAKLKGPDVSEARGDWSIQTIEKMSGPEVVYLTDTSSSTSSIYDLVEESEEGSETDASIRMITPTIEVTDTESLLKQTFRNNDPVLITTKDKCYNQVISSDTEDNRKDSHIKSHEIIVLSTDNINTNLFVKDLNENEQETIQNISKESITDEIKDDDLKMKVLKCELNDATNNLINQVSDSETYEYKKETIARQDSSSSVGSSQCTAKYNPTYSSLNDVSNMHDEYNDKINLDRNIHSESNSAVTSHVKDVFEYVSGYTTDQNKERARRPLHQPSDLRELCVRRIATFPYGDTILEELASVSERLQNINIFRSDSETLTSSKNTQKSTTNFNVSYNNSEYENMPFYPLPDISTIEKVSLPTKPNHHVPPPVQPRNSSLKKHPKNYEDDQHWTGLPTNNEPVYVCLSPSQKMLMEKTNTVITKEDASELVEMHRKYVDRRGYNECYNSKESHYDKSKDNAQAVPFKSQTGNRLLAIIRDPAVTNNINSYMTKQQNKSYDNLHNNNLLESNSFNGHRQASSAKDISSNFKPVPPPRPRKLSSSYYESDESSDFTDNSLRSIKSERKFFHYSTGTLNQEIENEVSTIQNMHKRFNTIRDVFNTKEECPRRPSLPKDLCEQQMEYIRRKEKEVEAEIKRLEQQKFSVSTSDIKGPRAPLISEKEFVTETYSDVKNYQISRKRDVSHISTDQFDEKNKTDSKSKLSSAFSSSQEEINREKMYTEYMSQMAEREERRLHKIIKISNKPGGNKPTSFEIQPITKSMSSLDILDAKVNNPIEKEFIYKARERWNKLGIKDPETEDERDDKNVYREPKPVEHRIKVIDGGEVKDVRKLPSHLQEFVRLTAKEKQNGTASPETVMIAPTFKARSASPAVWSPGAPSPPAPARGPSAPAAPAQSPSAAPPPPPPPPVWTPGASPQTPRKFRPVHFEESPPVRRKFETAPANQNGTSSEGEGRLRTSHSAPATGLSSLAPTSPANRLPKAQNPTVTLLQKAREGQFPRGSSYLQQERDSARLPRDRASPPRGDPVHALRREYASDSEAGHERRKMTDGPRKVDGIGPTTKDGMPVALRSEVKDPSKWYKKMYDTIHKNKYDDDYVTILYKNNRANHQTQRVNNKSQCAYFDPRSGYLSEPEGGHSRLGSAWSDYDSDATGSHRRRTASVQEDRRNENENSSPYLPSNKYSTLASARASQEVYKNQPGRIEDYIPGKSSVVDKEAKQWWDEVMDIFDGQLSSTNSLPQASPKEKKDITSAILSKSNMARALKESGYESDSTLVFRRRDDTDGPLSPAERRAAYKDLQSGGEPPLRGFRSPAPPRQESPRRYVESDVNIHYRCPVRRDPLPLVPERELARQQAEHMKRLYREQRRTKYLQDLEVDPSDVDAFDASIKELQDMQNRRHQDNFTPSQKTIVPLNRYDEADKSVARALYAFNGQTNRELSFRKGDLINVRRQIDANWYEGELHGRTGLFPYNYVEILKGDAAQTPKKLTVVEGRARAKFDFTAQTNLELPLKKGEVVVLTRRIDHNWWEGRNGSRTGIFPDSYVQVLQEPSQSKSLESHQSANEKPLASPAAHGLVGGGARRSLGAHSYTPQLNSPSLSNAPPATQPLPGYTARPATTQAGARGADLNNSEPLYVDTNAEAIPYRAMYKYRPQNPDELELRAGDTVYVLEQCDDGWYVGSSQRSGRLGTFPGNYVERI